MIHGSFFLLMPAFILLLLGFAVNTRMWHQLTGSCSRQKECRPWGTCAHFCQVLAPVAAKALVAPLTWIAVALLGANFYECAASGSSLIKHLFCKDKGSECREKLFKMPCNETISAEISSEMFSLQAQSQMIGWVLIASIMTVALISKCVSRSCSSVSYLQLMFWKIYSKKEEEVFEVKAKDHAKKLAERNTNCFFKASDPAPFPIPSKKEWQKISLFCTFDSQEVYYNIIHKHTSKKGSKSTESKQEDEDCSFTTCE